MFKKAQADLSKTTSGAQQPQQSTSSIQKPNASNSSIGQSIGANMQGNIVQKQIQKIQELEKQLAQEKQERETLERQHSNQLDQACKERDEYHNQLIIKQGQFDVLQAEYNTLMSKKQQETEKMSVQSQQEYKELNSKYNKVQQQKQQLEQQLEREKQNNYNHEQEIAALRSEIDELQDENDRLNMQMQEMQTEIDTYVRNNANKEKKPKNTNKIILDDEDDRPNIQETLPRAGSTASQPRSVSNTQPSRSLSNQKIQGAFNEAKKTINDLQDKVKLLKDENDKLKKENILEQAKRKDDEENFIKQLEQKEADIRELQAMLETQDNTNYSELLTQQKDAQVEQQDEQQPRINNSEFNKPIPVYHSLVNPSSPHNARKEYSQLINENNLLRQENKILREHAQKYDDIDIQNKKLQQQVTDLANQNLITTNNAFLQQQQQQYKQIQKQKHFDPEQFKRDLTAAKRASLKSRQSFFERPQTNEQSEQQSEQQKSQEAHLPLQLATRNLSDTDVSLLDQKNNTFDSLNENYKKACNYIKQCERELADKDAIDAENKVLYQNIEKLEEDNKNLHQLVEGGNAQIAALQQQIDQYKTQPEEKKQVVPVPIIAPQQISMTVAKPQVVEKGLQAGISQPVPVKHSQTQTFNVFESVTRTQPTLTNEDGFQYEMGDNQFFTVLNSRDNSIDRYYKLQNNMVVDEYNKRVDFNGTYKDNRGIFNVIHGIIDLNSQRSIDQFSSRQNYGDVYQQLQSSKAELDRAEQENQELINQVTQLRRRLSQVETSHIDKLLTQEHNPQLLSPPGQLQQHSCNVSRPASENNLQKQYLLSHEKNQPAHRSYPVSQAATSPTIPREHINAIHNENSKDIQTELYVVPADVYQREKERSAALSKRNTELQVQLRDLDRTRRELEKRKSEYKALVEHTRALNDQIAQSERQNMHLKRHNTELQAQAELLAEAASKQDSLCAEAGQAQAELFDNMRLSLRQKDAQIADLRALLQQQRAANLEQTKQLAAELEKMKQVGDHCNALEVNALKQDLVNQQNQIANKIIERRYGQKLRELGISDQPLQAQLLDAQKENKRLRKAGELIKEAFINEQNKSFAVSKTNTALKNALVLLFADRRWNDLETLLKGDDNAEQLEKTVKQRLGMGGSQVQRQKNNKANSIQLNRQDEIENNNVGYRESEELLVAE